MNLTSIDTFLAILETGSLVRASQKLHVTQSTVTARMKALEDQLGQTLLHRHKSGVEITAAGLKFKRYAEVMSGLWRQAKQETSLPQGIVGVCNIGCHLDLWDLVGRDVFAWIHKHHSDLALSIWPGEHRELDNWLANGIVDMAFSFHPVINSMYKCELLKAEPLILVSTQKDAPMRFDPNYIFVDAGEKFGHEHAAAYADADTAKISFGSASWALEFLLEQGGSAYLPQTLVEPYINNKKLFVIENAPQFNRDIYLVINQKLADNIGFFPNLIEAFFITNSSI